MLSGSEITKNVTFWRNEVNDTINQIAEQQTLLNRCNQKLLEIPKQLFADKRKYEILCSHRYPLQYAHAQEYLELKKQYGKNLITKLRFLVQLSDYLEIHCDKYRQKFTNYQNLLTSEFLWEKQIKNFEAYKHSKSFTLVNQYNNKNPDLTARQIDSIFLLSKLIKPMGKNFDLTDAYWVAEQTYHYILLLLEDYKQVTQVLLQLLQAVDHYLDLPKSESKESKFEKMKSFKIELPKIVIQFLTQASVGKMGLSWFNQRHKNPQPNEEHETTCDTLKPSFP